MHHSCNAGRDVGGRACPVSKRNQVGALAANERPALGNLAAALKAARAALPEAGASRLGQHADLLTRDRLSGLWADCLRAVQSDRPAVGLRREAMGELSLDQLSAFRSAVYDAVDATCLAIAPGEARALADWFAELFAQVTSLQQQRCEAALRHSEQRFRLAIDRSTVAAFETDLDGGFTWLYNSKLPELVGNDMMGTRINELMDAEGSAAFEELKRHAVATGVRSVIELPLYIRSERLYRLFSFEVRRDANGKIVGFGGSAVDTTEIKRTQAELNCAVAFREQLMGILGHDLRNPVSAVRGIAGLLQLDEALPAKTKDALQRIDQAAKRMSEMIETILDFTRIQFHHCLPVSRSNMDFGELCRNVVDETLAGHASREISVDICGNLRVHWDYARMAQVVSNLLGNALTHGDKKAPVQLIVKTDQTRVTLDVTNRGPTISCEQAKTLFEPFVQGRANGNRGQYRGLGLGLYIARQVVASHGGALSVHSCDGMTTFSVALPRETPEH